MADETLYTTVDEVLRYQQRADASEEYKAAVAQLIDPVSRQIDTHCRQWFYARTETRRYDFQRADRLWLDAPLLTVTTLTNGDGDVLTTGHYFLYPRVGAPYHWIDINRSAGVYFQWSSTPQQCISLTGTWGKSTTAPTLVRLAAAAWVSRLLPAGQDVGVQSKSVGSFSVSYASSQVDLKETPGEIATMLSGFIYRSYHSMSGYS